MSLRTIIYNALVADTELVSLGYGNSNIFPNHSPDSPSRDLSKWMIIRWGPADSPPGRDTGARPISVAIWCYHRDPDFAPVDAALRRVRAVLDSLTGAATGEGGYILGIDWAFSSDDLYDETYAAVHRDETYRVVASGI